MIGILDSGKGGICAYRVVRRLLPRADILYLADRKNAPYGNKRPEELTRLTSRAINRLHSLGAEKILIACCTASSIHKELGNPERTISVPIITPTAACAASMTKNGRIAVIATEATVRSGKFSEAITARLPSARVFELAEPGLVALIESCADREAIQAEADTICRKIRALECDTLVLGCTHFSHARGIFEKTLKCVGIADAAEVGALALIRLTADIKTDENGKILYM